MAISYSTPPTSPLSSTQSRESPLTQSCHLFDHMVTQYVVDPAAKKLRKQTYFAVISNIYEKYLTHKPFNVFSKHQNPERFIDRSMHDPAIGASEAQGERPSMQDAHVAYRFNVQGKEVLFAGVFDGHGEKGEEAADYLKANLPGHLETKLKEEETLNETTLSKILTEMMVIMDQRLQKEITDGKSGTTASCCLMIDGQIFIPNVGDSRAVLVRKKRPNKNEKGYQMTEDANIMNPRFYNAIKHMEVPVGRLQSEGPHAAPRLNYELSLARELGYESASARPKISFLEKGIATVIDRDKKRAKIGFKQDDYLVIACDGLYDVASTYDVMKAVRKMDENDYTPQKMSCHLVSAALEAGTKDNVTVMVIKLN